MNTNVSTRESIAAKVTEQYFSEMPPAARRACLEQFENTYKAEGVSWSYHVYRFSCHYHACKATQDAASEYPHGWFQWWED